MNSKVKSKRASRRRGGSSKPSDRDTEQNSNASKSEKSKSIRIDSAERKRSGKSGRAKDNESVQPSSRWNGPFAMTLYGGILLWLSFPPIGLWPLALAAPIPWLLLATREQLDGRKPWLQIWLGAWATWLLLLYYIRLPHWMLNFGWLAMSAYLCCYIPAFIGLTRLATWQYRIHPLIAAPVAWVGTEFLRSILFGGFAISLLGHTLVSVPIAIQIADIAGGYGVSAAMMVMASAAVAIYRSQRKGLARWWPAAVGAAVCVAVLGYGGVRMQQPVDDPNVDPTRVALIQGSIDTSFPATEAERDRIKQQTYQQYLEITADTVYRDAVDLVVWPEGKFTTGPDLIEPSNFGDLPADTRQGILEHNESVRMSAQTIIAQQVVRNGADSPTDPPKLLVGCSSWDSDTQNVYNSALLFDGDGVIEDRYFKMHRVMFGEYIPLGDWWPGIYDITPIGQGLTAGKEPITLDAGHHTFAPSICFESTVPHLMRDHVRTLKRNGDPADVLVNLTDDGWFWGSAALDHHLTCNVFRAVELRKPVLVAANTGFSASIDSNGRVLEKGPRRATGSIVAEVRPVSRSGLYETIGDWPSTVCLLLCIGLVVTFFVDRKGSRSRTDADH